MEDEFEHDHEVDGHKLSNVDDPGSPGVQVQCVLVNECKRLRDKDIGVLLEYGIARASKEIRQILKSEDQMYAEQASLHFNELVKPSGSEERLFKWLRLSNIKLEDCF